MAAVQGDPDAALAIGGDGTVSVQLGPVIEAVKDRLEQQGVGFAANIPVVERSIVIAQNDAFVLIQTVYALAVAVGTWLPWVCLALLAAGVFVAKRRTVALVWTAAGLALTMLILAAGLGIGRTFFIGTVSPSIMPSDTASVLFDGLVELMLSTIVAFLVLSILVAVIAWFSGPWRPARAAEGVRRRRLRERPQGRRPARRDDRVVRHRPRPLARRRLHRHRVDRGGRGALQPAGHGERGHLDRDRRPASRW